MTTMVRALVLIVLTAVPGLAYEDRKVVEFLLAPMSGVCIHTPPPAPNRVVHVVYPAEIEVQGLFTPVWIADTMMAESSFKDVACSDGTGAVWVSYRLQPDMAEKHDY